MKPPAFEYAAPSTVDEALGLLDQYRYGGRIIAGGQSLMPMLNFRLLRPEILIDINGLRDLDFIAEEAGGVRIGGLTRHSVVKSLALIRDRLPILADAARHVAHLAVRNRGTFGGSLSHADPSSEFPLIALLLDATIVTRRLEQTRRIAARDFFVGYLATALGPGDILIEVELPASPPDQGWSFHEFSRRPGDFAIVSAAVVVQLRDGRCRDIRIGLGGVGGTALRAGSAERMLEGQVPTRTLIREAALAARRDANPSNDISGSVEYRLHLVSVLAERAIDEALSRATAQ